MQEHDETAMKLAADSEIIDSSREQHSLIRKAAARDHTSNITHAAIVKEPDYRQCIALRERVGNWFYQGLTCSDSMNSFVQKLEDVQRNSRDPKLNAPIEADKIAKIRIIETSRMQLDSNVIHPFVKVHIVEKSTGCYLQKKTAQTEPMIYHTESITFYDEKSNKYEASENDIILPFATNPCDFRKIGSAMSKWNQRFFINYPAKQIFSPDTVILFEILDFNHQALLYKDTASYDRDNFYRVAWAFLRPCGISKTHEGISKLELYRYKFDNKKMSPAITRPHIPSVYYDFIWSNHEKYEGYLSVQLTACLPPKYKLIEDEAPYPQHLFEDYRTDPDFLQRIKGEETVVKDVDSHLTNLNLTKFLRNNGKCEVPAHLVYKLQSARLGCFRTLFVGNCLFAACSSKKYTSIKVFSLEKGGEKVMTLRGHREVIYSMCATPNESFLITAGSDRMVRIWQLPKTFGEYIDEEQSEAYLRAEFIHAAAVYSTACIHIPLKDTFIVLTCCYDGFVRLWEVNVEAKTCVNIREFLVNTYDRSPYKVYPTACVVSEENNFIVGDSLGDIRIFDFVNDDLKLRSTFSNEELSNDEITCIRIVNKNNILVQASDNLIRHFELTSNKLRVALRYTGAQFETQLCEFVISPDNKYLLSASESGRPFMWDLVTGAPIPIDHLNLDIKGPLVTCSWHPKLNLVAFGGWVELCPVMVYGNALTQAEQKLVAAQMQ